MGADLVLAVTRWPTDAQGNPWSADDDLIEKVQRRVMALTDEQVHEAVETYCLGPDEEEFRQWLSDEVEQLFTPLMPRDVGTLTLDGKVWLITGGMTWGDSPTESYNAVTALGMLGLTDEPFDADS